MDLTLVAYYENKSREFGNLVIELQRRLASLLGACFTPYELQQVHSTIIGLEGRRDGNRILNTNYLKLQNERRYMDLESLKKAVDQALEVLPLQIRFGGFGRFDHYPFASRREHPFVRSFSIHNGIAVAIGWPTDGNEFPPALDRLRRKFNEANVLHKYHGPKADFDNDFFFVLGHVEPEGDEAPSLKVAECEMRAYLESREPIRCELRREHLSLVSYRNPALPTKSSNSYSVDDIRDRIEGLEIPFRQVDPKR